VSPQKRTKIKTVVCAGIWPFGAVWLAARIKIKIKHVDNHFESKAGGVLNDDNK
jgi:hypothetical protein